MGEVLSRNGYREKVNLATKLPHWMAKTKEDMAGLLERQLEKLQTPYIDYYLIHTLNGESWERLKNMGVREFLDDALKRKKIRHAGFSFHGKRDDFKKIVDEYLWKFSMIQYNYLDEEYQAGTEGA